MDSEGTIEPAVRTFHVIRSDTIVEPPPSGRLSISMRRSALGLGLLTAIGLFAVDMYLPVLPAIGADLRAGSDAVQATLMVFLITLGAGQLIAGPLSDIYGRKRTLYVGLIAFIIGSIGCAAASTIAILIGFRMVQALGACAVMVIPRAVVRDLYTGPSAAQLMSLIATVYSVSPILAPLAGSLVAETAGWRGVFGTMAALAAICLVWVSLGFAETRPQAAQSGGELRTVLTGYRVLLGDRQFIGLALIASLTLAGWFIYAANSPFVIGEHFGLSPRLYAVLFALNSVSFVAASQFSTRLATRFGLTRLVRGAAIGHFVTMGLMLLLTLAGIDRLVVLVVLLFVGFGLNGIIVPSTFVLAMGGNPAYAGTASALIGTLNFAGGAAAVALVAPFAHATPLPMAAGMAACSFIVFALGMVILRPGKLASSPASWDGESPTARRSATMRS
jgi:MFS transporter, DHA1 family, multidrug resistance protein